MQTDAYKIYCLMRLAFSLNYDCCDGVVDYL